MRMAAVPSLTPPERAAPRPAPPALEVSGLNKVYGGGGRGGSGWFGRGRQVRAAQDVELSVCPGETLGVVGESGSGKSTVDRCVMRLVDPSAGAIRIGGDDVARLGERRLRRHRRDIQKIGRAHV